MKFSVWNVGDNCFDYFEDGVPQATVNAEKPAHLRQRTLGSTIEQASWPLPVGARHVGQGPHAVGRVAIERSKSLAGLGDATELPLVKAGLLAIAGALAVKVLLPKRRKR